MAAAGVGAEEGGVSADGGSTDGTALAEARILVQGQVRWYGPWVRGVGLGIAVVADALVAQQSW